jgi:hypothetical protein
MAGREKLGGSQTTLRCFKTIKTRKPAARQREEFALTASSPPRTLHRPSTRRGQVQRLGGPQRRNSAPYPFRKRWGAMATKTKKFEFYSETLKAALEEHAKKHNTTVDDILEVSGYQARGEMAFVPHYEEPSTLGNEKEYPFLFVDHKSRLNREGRSANCTWYHEFRRDR